MEELKAEFGIVASLIEGDKGIFDVRLNGTLVFSKHQVGRHSEPGEVTTLLKAAGMS